MTTPSSGSDAERPSGAPIPPPPSSSGTAGAGGPAGASAVPGAPGADGASRGWGGQQAQRSTPIPPPQQPAMGQPGYDQQAFGKSGYGPQGFGQPGYGQQAFGQPGIAQQGQPGYGQPGNGQPGFGEPASAPYGQRPAAPGYGQPAAAAPARPAALRQPTFAPPPPRFRPEPEAPKTAVARRATELGEDPTIRAERKRPWLAWALAGVAGVAAIALVVGLLMNLGSTGQPEAPTITPQAEESSAPTSTRPASNPVAAQPGLIPITQDVKFEPGIQWVGPSTSGWRTDTSSTRDPNAVNIEDPSTGAMIYFTYTGMDSQAYTDEDLTRSQLETAAQGFVSEPKPEGEPFSYIVHGQGGYDLELLAQKVTWGFGDDAWVITRLMPQSDSRVDITVVATETAFENPNSSLNRKLAEITFNVA